MDQLHIIEQFKATCNHELVITSAFIFADRDNGFVLRRPERIHGHRQFAFGAWRDRGFVQHSK